ncbi:MAG: substrate-binding domain-containing protein, partial [Planctomycetota bacterium]
MFVCSVLVVVIAVGRMGLAASGERGLKIVCTDSAEHMTRSLLDVFSEMTKKDGGQPGEQFTTKGSKNAAIHRFARGHDLMLCWGPVGGKLPRRTRYLWNKHAPEEYIVGAMAVALVVHADNPVDSLSLSQVRSIFSGQTGNWAAVGGEDRPIERYGPPHEKPFMRIYRDRCQPMGKDDLNRKGNSEGVLSAVVADPYAIGIVDAARTISTGRSARMISIDGVRVNARSVGSGQYPLGERLFLYVSPEPSQTARDFVQCVMSDQHNKLSRDHGLVPAFRATESSVVGGFRSLYAADLKRVKKTSEHSDDLELANELIDAARTMEVGAETARAMGKAAYELASDVLGGETTA